MIIEVQYWGLLPQDGDPETPDYPVGIGRDRIECKTLEEAISFVKEKKSREKPGGDTLTSVDFMDITTPGVYKHYSYDLETGKLRQTQ